MTERPSWAPTVDSLLSLHEEVIRPEFGGGSQGVRSINDLDAIVNRPWQASFGQEHFASHYEKAAALMESLIRRHPFVDGNKRTAFVVAATFLEVATGLKVSSTEEDEEAITLALATNQINFSDVAMWLEKHAV